MRLLAIEKRARDFGIKDTWKYSKKDMIRMIQRAEGNKECFATRNRAFCGQLDCCWRSDCT